MAWAAERCQDHLPEDNGASACYPDSPANVPGSAEPQSGYISGSLATSRSSSFFGRIEGQGGEGGDVLARAVGWGP